MSIFDCMYKTVEMHDRVCYKPKTNFVIRLKDNIATVESIIIEADKVIVFHDGLYSYDVFEPRDFTDKLDVFELTLVEM